MSETENLVSQPDIESVDGSYQIAATQDGVFLSVFPPKGAGSPVREPVVLGDLKSRNVKDFNMPLVMRVVKEATGEAVKVANTAPEEVEPEIQVLVDRDRMEASLQLVIPRNARQPKIEELYEKLQTAGVVFGIDEEAVKKAFERPGSKVTVARGEPVRNGADSSVKIHFDAERKGKPLELEDGRVDFKDLNLFTVVNEGDLLAEKIPADQGEPGTDVLGQAVIARPGRDLPVPAGKNTYVTDNKVFASISGQAQLVNGKVTVLPVIEIKGDVDLSTGNIEFVGNVVIRGSVQAGFSVKADGNVEIFGAVSGGSVEGKNIVVKMGIQGMHRGQIYAKENLTTKFIENAVVNTDGDVIVSDVILHSTVNAGKKVIVEGRRGFIAGGHILAAEEIRAKVVGTHLAVATDLEVGVNPNLRNEYTTLRRELKQGENTLDQAQKALTVLRAIPSHSLPQEKRDMLLKLTKTQFQLTGQLETIRKRISEIDIVFEEVRYGKIRVSDLIYPGVKIVIGSLVKPVREIMKFSSFYAEDGEIKVGSFR